jgi:GAF domain-containing protein
MEPERERLLTDPFETSDAFETSRLTAIEDAVRSLRGAMAAATGLLSVSEAAASVLLELAAAKEVSISLLDGDHYWDVVDVSADPVRGTLFPDYRYRLTDFPVGSERLLAGKGYVASDANEPVMVEYTSQAPYAPVGSIMSAPIMALGGVHGEVFLIREVGATPFSRDELELVSECVPLLGARLPALIAAYKEAESDPAHSEAMAQLTHELDVLLEDTPTD